MGVTKLLILLILPISFASAEELPTFVKPEYRKWLKASPKTKKPNGELVSGPVKFPTDVKFSERVKILLGVSDQEIPPLEKPGSIKEYNGGRGPGGGDGMFCVESKHNRFNGFYSYTYIQTRKNLEGENSGEYKFPKKSTCLDNLNRIQKKLAVKNPILAAGLSDFIKSLPINKKPQSNVLRLWKPFSEGNTIECAGRDIKDEHQLIDTPNCVKCQIFNRSYGETRSNIIYNYDSVFLDQLKKNPQQCSYALIHEWARDFIKGAREIYYFTNQLHSKEFHNDGIIDHNLLDEKTATCLKEIEEKPIKENTLDIYFEIMSQVPASIKELEENKTQTDEKLQFLSVLLEMRLKELRDGPPPLGMNDCHVSRIHEAVSRQYKKIKEDVKNEKMKIVDAIAELQLLSEGSYPGQNIRSAELHLIMMFCPSDVPPSKFEIN